MTVHERHHPPDGSPDTITVQLDALRRNIEATKAQLDAIIRSAHDRARLFGTSDAGLGSRGGGR